jgi:hypothetical protein
VVENGHFIRWCNNPEVYLCQTSKKLGRLLAGRKREGGKGARLLWAGGRGCFSELQMQTEQGRKSWAFLWDSK